MTITKADLANALHENLGINKREALELVMAFFEEISAELERGDTVKLSGFGVFCLREEQPPGPQPQDRRDDPGVGTTRCDVSPVTHPEGARACATAGPDDQRARSRA